MDYDVVIIGAGLSGLACASILQQKKLRCVIAEADSRIGGRIQTDIVHGFRLDRGFQVLQTGYPEAQRMLNYGDLELQKFPAGVAVRNNGKFHVIADPRHHLRHLFSTVSSPIGTLMDRLHMLRLARAVSSCSFVELFSQPEERTIDFLQNWGFSKKFITSFFVPFFAGACLDRKITASSRVLKYIFRVFAQGDAALPAKGMAEIPAQLASTLPKENILLNSSVVKVESGQVLLDDGTELKGKTIVLATSAPDADTMFGHDNTAESVGESCLYFSADWVPPFNEPFLVLNGEGEGPINNIAFPSLVAPQYSSSGKTLIAVVVLGQEYMERTSLVDDVRRQCQEWFGRSAANWDHLHTYSIAHALPRQEPPTSNPYAAQAPYRDGVWISGEHNSLPGTQWALLSGRMIAESIVAK
jgi:phytoene dehydrogenase-like protein